MDRWQSRYGQFISDDVFKHIWEYLYKVKVPYLATMSEDYIRQFGVPSSGDKAIDKEQMRQLITTYMSIEKMVELYKQGVPIRLIEPQAAEQIYKYVSQYLEQCKTMLERQINIGDAPLEDFLAMDYFANSVYEHAKYHMVADNTSSALSVALSRYSGFKLRTGRISLLPSSQNDSSINPTVLNDSINDINERESLSELFKKQMGNQYYNRKPSL